ncbi:MAG: acyl-CoA dehydratase activase [Marinilabiliaceae bacterium]|jgi:predicted CoA-substrate-specific enzyme activase|nr:acyl-CoA dehydratase activase [Marinilabiliaceae bacterium]
MESSGSKILSIDIGSVAISAVLYDSVRGVHQKLYRYHHGRVESKLPEVLGQFDLDGLKYVVSPSANNWLSDIVRVYDSQACLIKASKYYYNKPPAVLMVGAGKFQLLNFDSEGKFLYSSTSTSCAAGTGSFLDQQAGRLDLGSASDLADRADKNRDDLPEIASRCSVFAKTDLIHAQQAGYSLESICDSLCRGLAKNICDTVFTDSNIPEEIVFAGGVSLNRAVARHIEKITGASMKIHDLSVFFPAIGAALLHAKEIQTASKAVDPVDIIKIQDYKKEYVYKALSLKLSNYPEFNKGEELIFESRSVDHPGKVQVDTYSPPAREQEIFIGIDIGSTSTKAIITDKRGLPLSGFYTYTHGQPLSATKIILDAIRWYAGECSSRLIVKGLGTTGSGRKFIGSIIGADSILDEITTHARAAFHLNPDTDTIIEIGGQDAKFTLLRNGQVTFSKMNSVCAAGTGSFIEEQAQKMNVSLGDYSSLAENAPSPLASDRCTVFMERDINYYVNRGYSQSEILAAVLHSVRDNYLKKVAVESLIGENVCFQGATAKNKALVAAFEAKLEKQIFVSPYCHLTGALGTALLLADEFTGKSSFKGFGIIDEKIEIKGEICELCNNHCRISVADVMGEKVAYGFLCGRDYKSQKFVDKNISGFDLIKSRKNIINIRQYEVKSGIIIGLPAAIHMFSDLKFWTLFFHELGYPVVTSSNLHDPLEEGKMLSGAEFCAPMHSMYGHVNWLKDKCDYIFLPGSLENRSADEPFYENYCYYTQFSPQVVSLINSEIKQKTLTPLLYFDKGREYVLKNLHKSLKNIRGFTASLKEIREAWQKSESWTRLEMEELRKLFHSNFNEEEGYSVVLLGRPYLVLAPSLNKGIPEIFGSLGIKCFYQDMLEKPEKTDKDLTRLLKSMPWHFAVDVLLKASTIARASGLYPVFVTGFKCAPDSFVLEYFQKLMDASAKPYLILQIDEHDSNVGYETRIEAAIRSFRGHYNDEKTEKYGAGKPGFPTTKLDKNKTLLFPNWDQLAGPLLTANLRRFGYRAELLEHTMLGIQKAMSTNTGQCLPLNIIAQDGIEYIRNKELFPESTSLWITETRLTCNIRMYPQFIKTIFENQGGGLEKVDVYSGEIAHNELSLAITYYAYFAYMFSGLLRRVGCKLRPYELNPGETDRAIANAIDILTLAFEGKAGLESSLKEAMKPFHQIKTEKTPRPLVAIFGDFFVRDNDVMNQGLIYDIERYGGEVHTTPYNEFYYLSSHNVMRRREVKDGKLVVAGLRALAGGLNLIQRKYYRHFEPFLGPQRKGLKPSVNEKNLNKFNIDKYHSGESYDNLLKIFYIAHTYPETKLFVQANPAFCCPSLITEAMKKEIWKHTGIPIVTITYDGTTEKKNDVLAPYLSQAVN